jgi:polysaccharide deacetylase family protein (PEP-CTERM system associated)
MKKNAKYAVLSMDVEDWYHLYYFKGKADTSYSMLDGLTNYIELMNRHNIKTTFFVLSELADIAKEQLLYATSCGHEIACHGKTHMRPTDFSLADFEIELAYAKAKLEDTIGHEVVGYRAPCFSIDDERYKVIQRVGFKYSSSKMDVEGHPLYGELNLTSFAQPVKGIYAKDGMIEFALSTQKFCGRHIAVSGGGWIRLLPWELMMKPLIVKYLQNAKSYTLYIHPFELSRKAMPKVPGVGFLSDIRARRGLGKVDERIEQLIVMLNDRGFRFGTFSEVRKEILTAEVDANEQ